MSLGSFFLALIVFVIIVLVHEFGHFIVAKLSGIKVEEFAIGMGPKILSKQVGETLYSIRLLPLGGFCRLTGEDEDSDDSRAFNKKPVFTRIAVIIFGPIMNFLLAILIFSLVITQTTVINEVMQEMPAYDAGIISGDQIISINGNEVEEWEEIKPLISNYDGNSLEIILKRNNTLKSINVLPVIENEEEGAIIGIKPYLKVSNISLKQGISTVFHTSSLMFDFLAKLFVGKASTEDVAGPVGIFVIINETAKFGFLHILNLMAFLSLNLGIINLLPIPALDGGKLVFLLFELIRRKPINAEKEGFIHFLGFVLLMALALLIAFRDIKNLIH